MMYNSYHKYLRIHLGIIVKWIFMTLWKLKKLIWLSWLLLIQSLKTVPCRDPKVPTSRGTNLPHPAIYQYVVFKMRKLNTQSELKKLPKISWERAKEEAVINRLLLHATQRTNKGATNSTLKQSTGNRKVTMQKVQAEQFDPRNP